MNKVLVNSENKVLRPLINPSRIPGLQGMFSKGDFRTTEIGKVSQWNDISGKNNHATQATLTNQPLWNGSALEFSGNECLNLPLQNWTTWGITLFVKGKFLQEDDNQYMLDIAFNGGNIACSFRLTTNNRLMLLSRRFSGQQLRSLTTPQNAVDYTSTATYALVCNYLEEERTIIKDNTQVAYVKPDGSGNAAPLSSNLTITLGARPGVTNPSWSEIEDILIYNRSLTPWEIFNNNTYLMNK